MNISELKLDQYGFLAEQQDWNQQVADAFAAEEAVTLDATQWQLVDFVRGIYFENDLQPNNRALVKLVKQQFGEELGNSIKLLQLFGENPARKIARIGGLPIPPHCL